MSWFSKKDECWGFNLDQAAGEMVRRHLERPVWNREIDSIEIEQNGVKRVLTDLKEIQAFIDQHKPNRKTVTWKSQQPSACTVGKSSLERR